MPPVWYYGTRDGSLIVFMLNADGPPNSKKNHVIQLFYFTRIILTLELYPGNMCLGGYMFTYTAFDGSKIISQGTLAHIALSLKQKTREQKTATLLVFSDLTGRQIDIDLSGTDKQVLDRLKVYSPQELQANTGAGRPKLGVMPREISLLPNHWEWLLNQDGGSSAVIRNLIDEKMKSRSKDKVKSAQETTYKFLSAIAGDLPNFEEAIRFLYRKDKKKFSELISSWPKDIIKYSMMLASDVFE